MTATYEGGCLCGAVRYRVTRAPLLVEYCHCGMCRRASGAPVTVWLDVPTSALVWLGRPPTFHDSSPDARRGFCPHCGGALVFQPLDGRPQVSLTAASLDDPARWVPQHHIHDADRVPWLGLADDLPRYPGPLPPPG